MRKLILAIALLGFLLLTMQGWTGTFYTWIDDNGTMHITDKPPRNPEQDVEEIEFVSPPPSQQVYPEPEAVSPDAPQAGSQGTEKSAEEQAAEAEAAAQARQKAEIQNRIEELEKLREEAHTKWRKAKVRDADTGKIRRMRHRMEEIEDEIERLKGMLKKLPGNDGRRP